VKSGYAYGKAEQRLRRGKRRTTCNDKPRLYFRSSTKDVALSFDVPTTKAAT